MTERTRPQEVRREPHIRFLGQQDGPSERDLKATLIPLLAQYGVKRAYLARIQSSDGSASVALCLAASANQILVERLAGIFRQQFSSSQYIDILFLRDRHQEADLASVCQPFHGAA